MDLDSTCIGVDTEHPCKQRATHSLILPSCSDHKAALYYRLEKAGFDLTGEPAVKPLTESDRECYTRVGRDILGALMAYQLGVTHRTAMKSIPEIVDDGWIITARDMCIAQIQALDRRIDSIRAEGRTKRQAAEEA